MPHKRRWALLSLYMGFYNNSSLCVYVTAQLGVTLCNCQSTHNVAFKIWVFYSSTNFTGPQQNKIPTDKERDSMAALR